MSRLFSFLNICRTRTPSCCLMVQVTRIFLLGLKSWIIQVTVKPKLRQHRDSPWYGTVRYVPENYLTRVDSIEEFSKWAWPSLHFCDFFIIMFLHNVQTVQGSASLNLLPNPKANNLKDVEDLLVTRTLISNWKISKFSSLRLVMETMFKPRQI